MRSALYLVILAFMLVAVGMAKVKEEYNPLRLDNTYKKVLITVEWDNPDLPPQRRESLKKIMEVRITTSDHEVWISKQTRNAIVPRDDYIELWKVLKKNKLWEIEGNALTDPRPIGLPQRTFIIKMEGVGEKYFTVDVENSKSKPHFLILNTIDALSKRHLGI